MFCDKKAEDYAILRADYLHEICEKVRRNINYGWQPIGGVVIDKEGRYLQTMVKYA